MFTGIFCQVLVLSTLFCQKFNKKKYNLKKIKEANAKLKELKPELEAAKDAVAQIQACMALAPNDPSRDEVRLSQLSKIRNFYNVMTL